MSNSVRTWEDEEALTGEIELTDAQLKAVCGAWDDSHHDDDPHHDDNGDDSHHHHHHHHFKFFKKQKVVFFEKEKISKAEDGD